jgi:uncharacterized protein YjiS (DUF1127 family)
MLSPGLTIKKDLTIMSALPPAGKANSLLLPLQLWRSPVAVLLARLFGSWRRQDSFDELRGLTDAQLRDIGIERHRIGPSVSRDLDRLRSW